MKNFDSLKIENKATKILEFRQYDEKSIFQIQIFKNSSTGITSDFFEEAIILDNFLNIYWNSLEFVFKVETDSSCSFIVKKNDNKKAVRKMKDFLKGVPNDSFEIDNL